jgi:hypothetical protein
MHYIVALGAAFAALAGSVLGSDLSPTYAAASWNPGPRLELGGFATSPTPDKYDGAAQIPADASPETPYSTAAPDTTVTADMTINSPAPAYSAQISAPPR